MSYVYRVLTSLNVICFIFASPVYAHPMYQISLQCVAMNSEEHTVRLLHSIYEHISGEIPYSITVHICNPSIDQHELEQCIPTDMHLRYERSLDGSIPQALNRSIDATQDNSIIVYLDDNAEIILPNFDLYISQHMKNHFPRLDGILHIENGALFGPINHYPIIGKKYSTLFGYPFNQQYHIDYYLNELTNISRIFKREARVNLQILKFDSETSKGTHDSETPDKLLFEMRRLNSYYLSADDLTYATPKTLSILICTLESRDVLFKKIYQKLCKQIADNQLQNEVEILYFKDNKQFSVGYKRNALLDRSNGKYTCFVDDDDDVSDEYIPLLYERLQHNPDCVALKGLYYRNNAPGKLFVHSIAYNSYFESAGVFYRPPNHLNPIRRAFAIQFRFPNKNVGEDTNWALQICKTGLIQTEQSVPNPYYHYLYFSDKPYG